MSDMEDVPLMTTGEVAALFRVDVERVRVWVRTGKLASTRTPGGALRFRVSDVQALLDETSGPGSPSTHPGAGPQKQGPAPSHDAGPGA